MLLLLDEDHKSHLECLSKVSIEGIQEFVSIVLEILRNGVNKELITTLANKHNKPTETTERCLDGLMHLLAESSRLMLSDIDFHDSVMALGLTESHCKALVEAYLEHRMEIRKILQELSLQPVQYHDLEWRLNVQLASRSLRSQITPNILLRLHTRQGDSSQSVLLDCDVPNLVNLTNTLEQALDEAKSQYTRRILRNIK